ncbi:hypothetical protein BH23BAC3_BH23BAC3_33760 [soil metagenome]
MKLFKPSGTTVFIMMMTIHLALTAFTATVFAQEKPNIVFIMVDDMGYDDLSGHGNPIVETPNLDKLSDTSVRFMDFNVAPVCAPTRASVLTGRQHYRTGVSGVHGGRDFMRLEEVLISEVLQDNGYATGIWGKWHTGKTDGYLPWDRGFDEAYYSELYVNENNFGYTRDGRVNHEKWASEVITDYAIDFIDRNKDDKPFFAHLSYLAPHEPWEAPEKYVEKYKQKGQREAIANLYGMIDEMDFHVGRLLDFLDDNGLSENTMVIFMSDNGPWFSCTRYGSMLDSEWEKRNPSNFNGFKGRVWQNGIKSPLFIRYGDKFTPAEVNAFVDMTDIFPSILDFVGLEKPEDSPPLDGESFLAALKGEHFERQGIAFYGTHDLNHDQENFNQWTPFREKDKMNIKFENQFFAVRDSRYKLILNPIIDEPDYPRSIDGYALFDMKKDPKETTNLYSELPEVAEKLQTAMRERFEDIITSEGSLKPPVYLVKGDISVVNGYGPFAIIGSVQSRSHLLTNFRGRGDMAKYTLQVAEAGRYKLILDKQSHAGSGFKFRISTNDQSFEILLNEYAVQTLGEIELPQGDVTFTFEMIERRSINPWETLNSISRFFLVAKSTEFSAEMIEVPN